VGDKDWAPKEEKKYIPFIFFYFFARVHRGVRPIARKIRPSNSPSAAECGVLLRIFENLAANWKRMHSIFNFFALPSRCKTGDAVSSFNNVNYNY